jgi:hypothetical protein
MWVQSGFNIALTNIQITGAALSNLLFKLDTIYRAANRTSYLRPEFGRSTFLAAGPSDGAV